MFNFLTAKERGIFLIGPILLVLLIVFLGFKANYWRKEMLKEEQLKLKWQNAYIELNHSVQNFAEASTANPSRKQPQSKPKSTNTGFKKCT